MDLGLDVTQSLLNWNPVTDEFFSSSVLKSCLASISTADFASEASSTDLTNAP